MTKITLSQIQRKAASVAKATQKLQNMISTYAQQTKETTETVESLVEEEKKPVAPKKINITEKSHQYFTPEEHEIFKKKKKRREQTKIRVQRLRHKKKTGSALVLSKMYAK